jgi:hypothetical protein
MINVPVALLDAPQADGKGANLHGVGRSLRDVFGEISLALGLAPLHQICCHDHHSHFPVKEETKQASKELLFLP